MCSYEMVKRLLLPALRCLHHLWWSLLRRTSRPLLKQLHFLNSICPVYRAELLTAIFDAKRDENLPADNWQFPVKWTISTTNDWLMVQLCPQKLSRSWLD
jgi:hypothetical protein